MTKNPKNVKRGKDSRRKGKDFEIRVRKDLEEKGWIVCRFDNNVKEDKLIQAKMSWRRTPFGMFPVNLSPGFPDFISYKLRFNDDIVSGYDVVGIECKTNNKLDRIEKESCSWLLKEGIFSKILIASREKIKNRIHINYENFKEKYEK